MNNRLISSIFLNNPTQNNNPSHMPTESKMKTFNSMDDQSEYYQEIDPVAN